jgi:hypothetical protein
MESPHTVIITQRGSLTGCSKDIREHEAEAKAPTKAESGHHSSNHGTPPIHGTPHNEGHGRRHGEKATMDELNNGQKMLPQDHNHGETRPTTRQREPSLTEDTPGQQTKIKYLKTDDDQSLQTAGENGRMTDKTTKRHGTGTIETTPVNNRNPERGRTRP